MGRELSHSEHDAIFQILQEEESKLGGIRFNADNISALDKKCQQIFPNWEASPSRKSNIRFKSRDSNLNSDFSFSSQTFSTRTSKRSQFSSEYPQAFSKELYPDDTPTKEFPGDHDEIQENNSTTFNYDSYQSPTKQTQINSTQKTPSPMRYSYDNNRNISNAYSDSRYTSPRQNNLSETDDDVTYLKNDLENLMQELRSVTKMQPSPILSPHLSSDLEPQPQDFNSNNSPFKKNPNVSFQSLSPTSTLNQTKNSNPIPKDENNNNNFDNTSIPKIKLSMNTSSPLNNDQNENSMSLPVNLQLQQENIKIKAQLMQIQKELEAEKSENENLRRSLKKSEELRIYYRQQFENLQAQLQKKA